MNNDREGSPRDNPLQGYNQNKLFESPARGAPPGFQSRPLTPVRTRYLEESQLPHHGLASFGGEHHHGEQGQGNLGGASFWLDNNSGQNGFFSAFGLSRTSSFVNLAAIVGEGLAER